MSVEIERKYLVKSDSWRTKSDTGVYIEQGYFPTAPGVTVRVRIAESKAFLTIKGKTINISRSEFEYEIPLSHAKNMLSEFCSNRVVSKTRYLVKEDTHTWEVDVFDHDNAGLVTAEIELTSENEKFAIPDWLGDDVSHDMSYKNSSLLFKPYSKWEKRPK